MCDCNRAVPAAQIGDCVLERADEISKKARQLHALLAAMSTPTQDELAPTTVADGLWLAMDLAEGIFESAVGFPLQFRERGAEVANGTH